MRPGRIVSTALLLAAVGAPGVAGAAPALTEHPVPGVTPGALTLGGDGNVWFTSAAYPAAVGRVTSGGTATVVSSGVTPDSAPRGITAGPGFGPATMWFGQTIKDKVGRVLLAGDVVDEIGGGGGTRTTDLAVGPDGNLWATASDSSRGAIFRITTSGARTKYTTGLTSDPNLGGIARGADGNLWFTMPDTRRIGRITTAGAVTVFGSAGLAGIPRDITEGPDGNLWFTQDGLVPAIGRITPSGSITSFTGGLSFANAPRRITAGADGNVYFTDRTANTIGKVTPAGVISTYVALTGANAGLDGITTGADGRLWFAEELAGKVGVVPVAPTASAVTASSVTDTAATVAGLVTPHGEDTDYVFEWGTTTAYSGGSTAPTTIGSGSGAQAATTGLTGLLSNTPYHVRLRATSASGITHGPDLSFTTTATGAPSATSLAPSGVDAGSATLHATVDPKGTFTVAWFAYGTSAAGLTARIPVTDVPVGAASAGAPFEQALSGLEPNTTYVFRVMAMSVNGTTEGATETFTTAALPPGAVTEAAGAITRTGATLNAAIDPRNSATTYAFEWGTTTAYGIRSPALDAYVAADHASHAVDQALTGLAAGTEYHFRVVATSDAGVSEGPDRTFTTDPAGAPGATALPATGVSATGATLAGTVNPEDAPTSYQFVWGTPDDPDARSAPAAPEEVGSDATDHDVSEVLTGLAPRTTYVFRLVADGQGTTTSAPGTFTTGATGAATPPTPAPRETAPTSPEPPEPAFGRTAVASVLSGTVRFRAPGSPAFVELRDSAQIPAGSVVDTRRGTIALESALDTTGRTQTARFRRGAFRLGLSRKGGGMVDIFLTERPTGCGPRLTARAARAKPPIKLWGSDKKGRYRTHGRNSVAVVRGTQWSTTETCAGTLTRVMQGAVAVRDKRTGRNVVVRANRAYLARPTR